MDLEPLVEYCQQGLTEEPLEYLYGRGVDINQIRDFNIGYYAGNFDLDSTFESWSKGYDLGRGALAFPLTDMGGVTKGIQFRSIDGNAKYKYIDYKPYNDGVPICFGFGQAARRIWETKTVVLVEGVFDLFVINRCLTSAVVATLTAGLSGALRRSLGRFVKNLICGYDNDKAGYRAFKEIQSKVKDLDVFEMICPKVSVPGVSDRYTKDYGELWELWGDEPLQKYLQKAANNLFPFGDFNAQNL